MQPRHSLQLSPEEMRRLGYRVIDMIVDHIATLPQSPVGAKASPQALHDVLSQPLSDHPADPHELLDFLQHEILPNNLKVDHPRFFAFVPGPNNFVSAMADALAAGLNVFNGTWLGGSAAAAMELTVVDWLRSFCGLPETAGGVLVSGGSVANLTALAAARHAMLGDDTTDAVAYLSDQTHSSVARALRVIGLHHIRTIESDANYRIQLDTLADAVHRDRTNNLRPFCIIANAGTTNTGAVDPLPALADFCAAENLWLHADGAYGAAAAICEPGSRALTGLHRVDSLSLDPHKWLFQSIECGCVLLRDREILRRFYRVMPEYLRDVHKGAEELHPCDHGIQLTRAFRSLKLWLSLRTFGLDAFRHAVARGFTLADFAENELRNTPGCRIISPANMAIVCFDFPQSPIRPSEVVDKMLSESYAFLTSTHLKGADCLRLCTINPRTTEADLRETIHRISLLTN
ncbi:MAG: aminotransferase class I/II-fold pyridoxal phosphate-dependent enzyme [Acidobacteria bacterium]|nr:aminotransferase class I/II-fold pyridoxal phosphate-dependent enzyme [Acidobacteriota bacterium]